MNSIEIQNDVMSVVISTVGGNLKSIKSKETGIEYLWQGDPAYWREQAPILFPIVGRLYEKTYTLNGETYNIGLHGFARDMEMKVEEQKEDSVTLSISDTEETRKVYPFTFKFYVTYSLDGYTVNISFKVENEDNKTLYCVMGGHPGFNVPLEEGLSFEDYDIVFPKHCVPMLIEFDKSVLPTGVRTAYPLKDGTHLPLSRDLFTFDAIVFTEVPRSVSISSMKGSHGVTVAYPQMPYVGFWQKPNCEAPFICVEPWSALPGRSGTIEDLSTMPDIISVDPGTTYTNDWSITVW